MKITLNEILVTVKRYQLNAFKLSETWLNDNKQLLNYASMPGYTLEYRKRKSVRRGGVNQNVVWTLKAQILNFRTCG